MGKQTKPMATTHKQVCIVIQPKTITRKKKEIRVRGWYRVRVVRGDTWSAKPRDEENDDELQNPGMLLPGADVSEEELSMLVGVWARVYGYDLIRFYDGRFTRRNSE